MSVKSFASVGSVLALALFVAGCGANAQQTSNEPPPPQVSAAPVVFKSLRQWDEFTGRLEPVEQVQIRPRVGGYIDSARFQEGTQVRKGQVLFQIDPRPFQAEVNRLAAETDSGRAKLELASANRQRGERLVEQGALARSEFERLTSEEKAARASLEAASAALNAAKLNLEFTRVTSPIDGRVSRAMITAGNLVTSADLLTTVVSENPVYASFNTDEQTFLKYAQGARGRPSPVFMGLMTEDGYPHEGKLVFVDNAMDAGSGTINGRALFTNPDGRFTAGLFARIRLVSDASESVALAPDRAVAADLGKRFVLVVGPKNVAEYRVVTLGPKVGDLRIIRTGLKPGEVIIVGGGQRVKPGQTVAPTRVAFKLPTAALAQVEVKPIQTAALETKVRAD
ncbi:MAG: efflux RND transporter periplasmic adaptor subunit [Pseudomonadota bacterium]|uniref:efflux RND transporter periplasmic adaptor subunit n=1 Tax=unclassified Phenylobacterium TaxID=2640670 RepID=UPI0006F231CE|nr:MULTISPECIES: efflux RND transporter periplasmic adaptor subunit [unclassified Phenylobacterium]KRB40192.1 RND transporter MFP subunit [Phenylobacterium sp. Root700]MBT9469855.1 efflux RND transporter periplasmic adaptor subunit [Phenylobacterium sp.]